MGVYHSTGVSCTAVPDCSAILPKDAKRPAAVLSFITSNTWTCSIRRPNSPMYWITSTGISFTQELMTSISRRISPAMPRDSSRDRLPQSSTA